MIIVDKVHAKYDALIQDVNNTINNIINRQKTIGGNWLTDMYKKRKNTIISKIDELVANQECHNDMQQELKKIKAIYERDKNTFDDTCYIHKQLKDLKKRNCNYYIDQQLKNLNNLIFKDKPFKPEHPVVMKQLQKIEPAHQRQKEIYYDIDSTARDLPECKTSKKPVFPVNSS